MTIPFGIFVRQTEAGATELPQSPPDPAVGWDLPATALLLTPSPVTPAGSTTAGPLTASLGEA